MNGKLLGGGEGSGSEMIVGTDKLREIMSEAIGNISQPSGDFIFPLYIGGKYIDTLVVGAVDRANFRSGGR